MLTRSDIDVTILRQRGTTYQVTDQGEVVNIYEITLNNKTNESYKIDVELDYPKGSIEMVVKDLKLEEEGHLKDRVIIRMPRSEITNGKLNVDVIVYGDGEEIDRINTKIIGPMM